MLEPRGELDLPEKALGAERRGQLGMQHLERDRPVVALVTGEVDRRHPAAAELPLEDVAVGERGGELGDGFGCHGRAVFRPLSP